MDVKGAFDHVSRIKITQKKVKLGIDNDWIKMTQFFLIDWQVKLFIYGYINLEHKFETRIHHPSLVFPISFLIYISGLFTQIKTMLPKVTCLLFVDD